MNQEQFSVANRNYLEAKREGASSAAQWDQTRRAILDRAKRSGEAWAL